MVMSVKVYDFLGNLNHKIRVDLEEMDFEGTPINDLVKDNNVLDQLRGGFKFFSTKSKVWVQVAPNNNLDNVYVLKEDFGPLRSIQIVLSKPKALTPEEATNFKVELGQKSLTVEHLLLKLSTFEKVKQSLKAMTPAEKSAKIKQLIGISLSSVYYYKTIVRKARSGHFDFAKHSGQPVKDLVLFVRKVKPLTPD